MKDMSEHNSINNITSNSPSFYNMATVANGIREFNGNEEEDANIWLRDVLLITNLMNFTEEDTLRIIVMKLRNTALSWTSETLQQASGTIRLEEFLALFKKRFTNLYKTELSLSNFLTSPTPTTREEFTDLLKNGTTIFELKSMNAESLAQVIIGKSPNTIKPLLFQAMEHSNDWHTFIQRAEQVAWLAFPDKILNRISDNTNQHRNTNLTHDPNRFKIPFDRKQQNNRYPQSGRYLTNNRYSQNERYSTNNKYSQSERYSTNNKYPQNERYSMNNRYSQNNMGVRNVCDLHGRCTHNTKQCATLARLREKEWRRHQEVNLIRNEPETDEYEGEEELDDINKEDFIYSINYTTLGNPFFIKGQLFGLQRDCLIDTGADVSIIHRKMIPELIEVTPFQGNVRSACGTQLTISNKLEETRLKILGEDITFSPLITENEPKYIILGVDVIKRYPEIINKIIQRVQLAINLVNNKDEGKEDSRTQEEKTIIEEYNDLFRSTIDKGVSCGIKKHQINTGTAEPIFNRTGRIPVHYEAEVEKEILSNLKLGIIRESNSPWSSRIVPVTKKDGSLRLCIDYRPLNKITIKDKYPIPRIDEILDSLAAAKIFTTLDATSGYYQLKVKEKDREKTAFSWKGGHYEFNRMPFGLCNAPATFQRAMDLILKDSIGQFVIPYLDDIIIYSKSVEEHKTHVKHILKKLKEHNIILNKEKCKFFRNEVKILGNIISEGLVKPDPDKIQCIKQYPLPTTVRELRSFLGIANYCREFIVDFAGKTKCLYDLLKGETKRSVRRLNHSEETIDAFNMLRKSLTETTSRAQPDFTKEFILTTDASEIGMGAILSQINEKGQERMISAFSKNFDKHQKNYSVTDKELLAVVKSIEHYRHYLLGKEFLLKTDHKALTYLWETKPPTSRLLRWAMKLQEFKFRVEYIKGEDNAADGYSRINNIKMNREKEELTREAKDSIIKEYHMTLGHGSPNNMKYAKSKRYKWPKMFSEIDEACKNCVTCKKIGNQVVNTKNKVIETTQENELWEVDLIGRIDDKGKNKFIFIGIDHFSKWIETKIIKHKTGEEIVKAIEELIIKKHGKPQRILSDCGLEFCNKPLKTFIEKHNLTWEYASPFHHQTTGAVERAIQTFMNKLKKLTNYGEINWTKQVEAATLAVNLSFNRAIGNSPFVLKHGRLPELNVDKDLFQPRIWLSKEEIYGKKRKYLGDTDNKSLKAKSQRPRTLK
ncbi:Retrovirus-related Pol polyprotein from transposon 17.6 [Nosema granulosis]|uniref:RNA-directed DNA polymerase n=1 Tax=Nosema granulosis TaxID=83296 RepID=A0A9P6KXW5_9MICR|nr:Retrovirus-related Pol polyprotein from transposon 17.6 [Nosema granulosis]